MLCINVTVYDFLDLPKFQLTCISVETVVTSWFSKGKLRRETLIFHSQICTYATPAFDIQLSFPKWWGLSDFQPYCISYHQYQLLCVGIQICIADLQLFIICNLYASWFVCLVGLLTRDFLVVYCRCATCACRSLLRWLCLCVSIA